MTHRDRVADPPNGSDGPASAVPGGSGTVLTAFRGPAPVPTFVLPCGDTPADPSVQGRMRWVSSVAPAADPSRGPAEANGVVFPVVEGRRSTSATGRDVVADALRPLDADLAEAVAGRDAWHTTYIASLRDLTRAETTTEDAAVTVARAGLASVHRRFRFHLDGEDLPLDQVVRAGSSPAGAPAALYTVEVSGDGGPPVAGLEVPLGGALLGGAALLRQVEDWCRAGVAEPSFAESLSAVVAHPEWLDLRDVTVVVLGAGSEMGPLASLARWGAHVVAVDLPGYATWRRLIDLVRSTPGRMSVPVSRWLPATATDDEIAAAAGVDLLGGAADVLDWLLEMPGPLTVGGYVYADGPRNVRAAVATDMVLSALLEARGDTTPAFLATPTDVFAVPAAVVADSRRRYVSRVTTSHRLCRVVTGVVCSPPTTPGTPQVTASCPLPVGRAWGSSTAS